MDRDILQSLIDFYQNQLLLGYYKKRGKSLSVPYVMFAIQRLLDIQNGTPIRVLDVGCGKGDLLRVMREAVLSWGVDKRVELYGLDYNSSLLKQVISTNDSVKEVYERDLRHDLLDDLKGKFDVVVSVNTMHEVYSLLLGENDETFPKKKSKIVKSRIAAIVESMSQMLSPKGSLIIYDGLDIDTKTADQKIRFYIKNKILLEYFDNFINEFKPWKLAYKQFPNDEFEMTHRDFHRFVTTFKYLNTSLWPIESRESYSYFSVEEYKKIFKNSKLAIESEVYSNNDLGLWNHNISILTRDMDFGFKSGMFMLSRNYVSSEFDHFYK